MSARYNVRICRERRDTTLKLSEWCFATRDSTVVPRLTRALRRFEGPELANSLHPLLEQIAVTS